MEKLPLILDIIEALVIVGSVGYAVVRIRMAMDLLKSTVNRLDATIVEVVKAVSGLGERVARLEGAFGILNELHRKDAEERAGQ